MSTTLKITTDVISRPTNPDDYPKVAQLYLDAYDYTLSWNIQTLSTGTQSVSDPIEGLLYVPSLKDGDPCIEQSSQWVPANVTRKGDLPKVNDVRLVGLAPWLRDNSECSLNYMSAARDDEVQTLIFFLSGNSTDAPPASDQKIWMQGSNPDYETDGWMNEVPYPVFAIPSSTGNQLMEASAQYSGNVSDVPHGEAIAKEYAASDYVRLYMTIDVGVPSNLPSLWILLLVVLAIVMTLMGLTSLSLHWLQLRRRRDLRRRVENGEVDLEALGIKRLTVPQEVLDEMPLYTYGSGEPAKLDTNTTSAESKPDDSALKPTEPIKSSRPTSPTRTNSSWPAPYIAPIAPELARAPSHIPTSLLQPTCPICLEEFIPANATTTPKTPGTIVRELPCQHIFHPECVDTFLRDSSSLCPMCKSAALPKGYCPKMITNAMVRRERIVRRRGNLGMAGLDAELARDPYAGNVSPLRRSRVVSWGAGVSMLSPYEGRRRMTPRATVPRIFRSPSQPLAQSEAAGTEMTAVANRRVSAPPPALTRQDSGAVPAVAPIAEEGVTSTTEGDAGAGATAVQPSSNPRRREWARQRAVAMLGRRDAPLDPDAEEERTMPRWRKGLMRVFPSMGPGR